MLHIEGPGRTVGELPLLDGGPYPASAVTDVKSRLALRAAGGIRGALPGNARRRAGGIHGLGRRLRHLVQVIETLAFRDVAARLASFLALYAEEHGRPDAGGMEIVLDRTHEELSVELGTARESVSRALKQLSQKGLIEPIARQRMRIPDVARLRTLGRPGERPHYE